MPERRFIGGGRLARGEAHRRDRMNVSWGDRDPRKHGFVRHSKVAVDMIVRHKALITPKSVRLTPGKAMPGTRCGKGRVKLAWRRAAGET
jgi:hypothetical protein